jgi:UDP-N-acetylmuramoylalanine--D-glutamate ligase
MSGRFEGERAVVVGLGVAGTAAARVLAEEGARVLVSEARDEVVVPAELAEAGVEVSAGGHEAAHLQGATLVVVSPGVKPDAPVVAWARERGLPVWGELELGARIATAPCVAVTGTNGKTTTTGMIEACMRASGVDAVACGNIGKPFPAAARDGHDVLVVECSSFQLEVQESFHPRISVLLNVAADHLDWHGSFERYVAAKARVFANQREGDTHVGNRDDGAAARLSRDAPCATVWFTIGEPAAGDVGFVGAELAGGWSGADRLGTLPFDTPAMRADAAACAAACHAFGVPDGAIRAGLASFTPARHRGETVARAGGVRFVDNSKATNPHATLAAVGDASGVVLIAGGDAKGVDLAPLGSLAPRLAAVVALGASAGEVAAVFEGKVPVRGAGSIEAAVELAFEVAEPGGTVLLAPACASWDMFRDYVERGERFTAAARALHKEDART